MPLDILMPALFPAMATGRLAKWRVGEGDRIAVGSVIADIETPEGRVEVAAVEEGIIRALLVPEGPDPVAVDTRIAVMTPAHELEPAATVATVAGKQRIAASPLARRMARSAGLDLASLKGTGTDGRIVERDISAALAAAAKAGRMASRQRPSATGLQLVAASPPSMLEQGAPERQGRPERLVPAVLRQPSPPAADTVLRHYRRGTYDVVPLDALRQSIAERAGRAVRSIPQLSLSVDCVLDALLAAIERMNTAAARSGRRIAPITHSDVLVKAMGLALQHVPAANATWSEIGLLRHHIADVAFDVAIPGGYLQPVIRQADLKSLSEIAGERADICVRAAGGGLNASDCEGGVTAVADFGAHGIRRGEAVVMPPHASVLVCGQPEKRPIVSAGQIIVATVMTCTLSVDQRILDAAEAAELLQAVKTFVEDPVRMLA